MAASAPAPARGQAGWVDPIRAAGDTTYTSKYGAPTTQQLQGANAPGVPYVDPKIAATNAAKSAYNAGKTTEVTTGGTAPPPTTGTLTANISSPRSLSGKVPPPTVVTSDAAEKDLANKKAQMDQLNTDTAAHQAIVNTPSVTPTAPAESTTANQPTKPPTYEEQMDTLLNGFSKTSSNIDTTEQNKLTPLQQQQQQIQTQMDKDAVSSLSKLNQISSGTYPLSPAEKNLIAATTATFQATINAQQTANTAFEGGIAETMASLGISTSAPTEALGLIHAAISSGVSKIADLDSQLSKATADLQVGFQKEDYAEVSDAWDKTSKYFNDRITTLQNMQTQVTNAAKQQKQDAKDYTSMALDTVTKSNQFTYQQKQDAIDNAFKQEQISETKRHDLVSEAQSAAATSGLTSNPVPLSANGAPSKLAQAQWLAQYPPNLQTQIKGLASYQLLPTSFPTRAAKGGMDRATAVALAKQYDPTYDENQAATRQKTATAYSDGTSAPSKSILALNTASGHLATLAADSQKLGNVGFEPINYLKNTVGGKLGLTGNAGARLDIGAVTGELAAAFKSSGATDQEIKSLGTIDSNSSPAQMKSYIESATALMGSKLSALQDSYTSTMGVPPSTNFLHPTAANDLLNLQQQGYNINVPQLNQTAPVQLKNFVASASENSKVYDQAKAAIMQVNGGTQPSADDIYQLLQLEGYIQ